MYFNLNISNNLVPCIKRTLIYLTFPMLILISAINLHNEYGFLEIFNKRQHFCFNHLIILIILITFNLNIYIVLMQPNKII